MAAGLLLTAGPGVGYLVAWVHDFGYQAHFNFVVPIALIAPQLGAVLAATVTVAGSLVVIYLFAEMLVSRRRPWGPIETRLVAIVVGAVAIGVGLYGSWGGRWDVHATVAWVVFVLVLGLAVFTPDIFGDPRSLRDRLKRRDERAAPPASRAVITTAIVSRLGEDFLILLAVVLLILVAASGLGNYQAQIQTDFLVSDASTTSPPEVVLAIYGDTVVFAPFDKSKHSVRRELDIIKLGSQALHLHWVSVGALAGS